MKTLKKRLFGYDAAGKDVYYVELAATSSETLPTSGIVSGSRAVQVDTGKQLVFDGESGTPAWTEVIFPNAASGGD